MQPTLRRRSRQSVLETSNRILASTLLALGSSGMASPTPVMAAAPDITVEVIEVNVGPLPGHPSEPVIWNGLLFFGADDGFDCSGNIPGEVTGDELGEYGQELFTAGIATGPILVKNINTFTSGGCGSTSQFLHERAASSGGALIMAEIYL